MISENTEDFYQLLGVEREASALEIRKAYRALVLQHHPDRNPEDSSAEEKVKKIAEAYQTLSDPKLRAGYDLRSAVLREAAASAKEWATRPQKKNSAPKTPRARKRAQEQWDSSSADVFSTGNEFESGDLILGISLGAFAYLMTQEWLAPDGNDFSFVTLFFSAFLALPAAPVGYALGGFAKSLVRNWSETFPENIMWLDGVSKLLPLVFSVAVTWGVFKLLALIGWEIPTPTLIPSALAGGLGCALGSAFGRAFTSVAEQTASKLFGVFVGASVGAIAGTLLGLVACVLRVRPFFDAVFFEQAINGIVGAAIGSALGSVFGSLRSSKK